MRINTSGNWIQYCPHDGDVQVSHIADFQACGAYSLIHIIEMLEKFWTGSQTLLSERAQAKLSNTTPQGNSLANEITALNTYGVLTDGNWPDINNVNNQITWGEYYTSIPQTALQTADKGWKATLALLSPKDVARALQLAPVWTIVGTSSGENHIVAQINETQFFDSYEIIIKNFSDGYPILSQWNLQLTYTPMSNAEFVQKAGTPEMGFYLPCLSEDALKDKALNLGINILNPDGTINNAAAKQVTGL
jgi:hypothetical protein